MLLAIQVAGVLVILSSLGSLVWLTLGFFHGTLNTFSVPSLTWVSSVFRAFDDGLYGVAALALAQLLRYVFGERQGRGLLLRFADKGLMAWAGLGLGKYFFYLLQYAQYRATWWQMLTLQGLLVPIARVLVLVSIALILRKALPIVEESRSLV